MHLEYPTLLQWEQIAQTPDSAGAYAWYYTPRIAKFDIEKIEKEIKTIGAHDRREAHDILKAFLSTRLFSTFEEHPYDVSIKGKLKPSYKGQLQHQFSVSDSLVNRLVDEPERISDIFKYIEKMVPLFASPLYVGMADNLKRRLSQHVNLIIRFRDSGVPSAEGSVDAGFAAEVVRRNMSPQNLSVSIYPVDDKFDRVHADVENILNRILHPVIGSN